MGNMDTDGIVFFKPNPPPAKRKAKKSRKGRVLVGRTTCTICNKVLAYCSVIPHMNSCHPDVRSDVYVCRVVGCELEFDSRSKRYRHLLRDHGHRPKTRKRMSTERVDDFPPGFVVKESRYCFKCRETFPNRRGILAHKDRCQHYEITMKLHRQSRPAGGPFIIQHKVIYSNMHTLMF